MTHPERQRFTPAVNWKERSWLWNERLLHHAVTRKDHAILIFLAFLPLLLLLAALVPVWLLWVALTKQPATPRGPHALGVHDTYFTAVGSSLRLRIFYPAQQSPSVARRMFWLPSPRLAYASAYLRGALPMPGWLARLLGSPLSFMRAPPEWRVDAPPLAPEPHERWPVILFSHGLLGSVAAYSSLLSDLASHGNIVLALEHTDGTAAYTVGSDGRAVEYLWRRPESQAPSTDAAWRASQARRRSAELLALRAATAGVLADSPLAALVGRVEERVTLLGHSFGAATALESCAALVAAEGACAVASLALLDPWMEHVPDACYDRGALSDASSHVSVLVAPSQSMMWPQNADGMSRLLRARPAEAPSLFVELSHTRHQEASDFPLLGYAACRLICMAGALPPLVALHRVTDVTLGFLTLAGAQRAATSDAQRLALDRLASVRRWVDAGGGEPKQTSCRPDGSGPDWLLHL